MANGFSRFFKLLKWDMKGEKARLNYLSEQSKTVELSQLNSYSDFKVIDIDIGFGHEFWMLPSTEPISTNGDIGINQGKLILRDGSILKSSKPLCNLGFAIEKVFIRF